MEFGKGYGGNAPHTPETPLGVDALDRYLRHREMAREGYAGSMAVRETVSLGEDAPEPRLSHADSGSE